MPEGNMRMETRLTLSYWDVVVSAHPDPTQNQRQVHLSIAGDSGFITAAEARLFADALLQAADAGEQLQRQFDAALRD